MKYIYAILSVFILASCSPSDKESVKTVENAINASINNYQKISYKDIANTGYPVEVIDITFSKRDFDAIVTKIDLSKYRIENNDYYRDFTSDSVSWHIAILSKENKIRYSKIL